MSQDKIIEMDDGWTEKGRLLIERLVFEFEPSDTRTNMMIDNYAITIRKMRGGIDIACYPVDKPTLFLMGIMIYESDGSKHAYVYHNGHGPYTEYGLEVYP